jgi:F-box associated protein
MLNGPAPISMLLLLENAAEIHSSSYVSNHSVQSHDTIPCHPLGVKPSGNGLTAAWDLRTAMGDFNALSDDAILVLLEYLDSSSLLKLGRTCKALYAFTRSEDLWKTLFIR